MTEGRQQRRSARISALDSWKLSALTRASGAPRGKRGRPPSSAGRPAAGRGRKRGRKKRRLRSVVEVVVNSANDCGDGDDDKGESNQQYDHKQLDDGEEDEEKERLAIDQDDDLGGTDRSPRASSVPWIPDKKIFELILDILQKKDTHEIFAEPVDSEEVEGYYEIIEEPMDFGTMRAKLQEGMYTTLEQFERDVFLIFSNAMHFNSSTTIYYRQARSIQELAKKTFHRLKTDPENFVLDHLSRNLKTGKLMKVPKSGNSGAQGESRNSDFRSAAVASTCTIKPRFSTPHNASITTDEKQGSFYSGLSSRRNRCSSSTVHGASLHSDRRRDPEDDLFGSEGWRSCFSEEDRRSTYRSSDVSSSRSDSVFFPLHVGHLNLVYVNQGDFGYVESLARFASDLGPVAQMVAARKIKRCKMLGASNAVTSSSPMHANLVPGNMSNSCSASSAHSDATADADRGQIVTVQVQPGPHHFSSSQMVPYTASPQMMGPSVSQSKLLDVVPRNSSISVGAGHGDANIGPVRPTRCHDNGIATSGPANPMPSSNMGAKLNQELGFTRNSMFPHLPGSAPAFSQLPRQCAVMDMSFVQARLNGMSACSNRQWQASKPTEPLMEMPVPSATKSWEQAGSQRNQPMPPTQPISDNHQPDLALQL